MNRAFRSAFILAMLLAGSLVAQAQIVFTVTATADADGEGYTTSYGNYTFVYTVTSFTTGANSSFDASQNFWDEEDLADDPIFTSLTGTGVAGSLIRPTSQPWSPYSYVEVYSGGDLLLYTGSDANETIGVTTLFGTHAYFVTNVSLSSSFSTPDIGFIDPVAYFAGYTGSYAATGSVSLFDTGYNGLAIFTVSNVTISAVPEPATCAAIFGVTALGLATWHRRRAARPSAARPASAA